MLEPSYVRLKNSIIASKCKQLSFETREASENRVGLAEGVTQRKSLCFGYHLIDFEHCIVHRRRHAARRSVIPEYSSALRRREPLQDCQTHRIDNGPTTGELEEVDAITRNCHTRSWRRRYRISRSVKTGYRAVNLYATRKLLQHRRISKEFREIALPHPECRHRNIHRLRLIETIPFIVEKEERAI